MTDTKLEIKNRFFESLNTFETSKTLVWIKSGEHQKGCYGCISILISDDNTIEIHNNECISKEYIHSYCKESSRAAFFCAYKKAKELIKREIGEACDD